MILRGNDIYSSQDEESSSESEESFEDKGEDTYPCDGNLHMIRRILNSQPSPQQLS